MNTFATITAALVMAAALTPAISRAAPVDGSVPMVCAGSEIRECEAGGECTRRMAEEVNLPTLMRLDSQAKTLAALGDKRTTPIQAVERRDGRLVMYGGQEGRGWTMVIVEATGKMSGTVVDDQVSFVIFGACAAP